jgi:hypothetical protein
MQFLSFRSIFEKLHFGLWTRQRNKTYNKKLPSIGILWGCQSQRAAKIKRIKVVPLKMNTR